MPRKKSKKGKKDSKGKTPSKPRDTKLTLEEGIKAYIGTYIDSYMDYVEELNLAEDDLPLFYTHYPFEVKVYVLPDNSTCTLFKGLADATTIELIKAEHETVDKEIAEAEFDYICCYTPTHPYSKKEAQKQAKKDVEWDVDNTKAIGRENVERKEKEDALKSIRLLGVAIPWMGVRETEEYLPEIDEANFTPEDLGIKEGEDFSTFSERLKNIETSIFPTRAKEEPIVEEPPIEEEPAIEKPAIEEESLAEPPPKPPDIPPPDEITDIKKMPPPPPPPKPPLGAPSADDTSKSTKIPVPPPGGPGTNISIEIKQPEGTVKGEEGEIKKNDLLRLKKTLYTQAIDIEDLKKKIIEMNNKLGNVEHMRQTVFRMNRKVHDTDTKLTLLENSNREVITTVNSMREEQTEENKKMRRFITDRSKKARNQAMTLAIIAIVISLATLPFVLILVVKYWDQIKNMLGL